MPAEAAPSPPRPAGRRGVAVGGTVLLVLVSLVAGFFILELIAGRLVSRTMPPVATPRFAGDLPRNSQGFRDFEYEPKKLPGTFRILALGDSFTWGSAVNFDDAWPKRLERYLNHVGRTETTRYQVLNLGFSRRSTPQELRTLKKRTELYRPDLVVVGYCLNDAEDWDNPAGTFALRAKENPGKFEKPTRGIKGFLYRRSKLARLAMQRLFNSSSFSNQLAYYRGLYADDFSGWKETRGAMKEFGAWSAENKVPVVVMIFPLFSFGLDDKYPLREVHRKVGQAANEAGLEVLDLFDAYRGSDRLRLEAIPYRDPHPSEIGHRIAAEALLFFLQDETLLPAARDLKHPPRSTTPSPY